MVQEQAFLQVLADAAFYQVTDAGMLRLFNSSLTLLAEFEPGSSDLAGTSWDVINYNNGKEAVVSLQLGYGDHGRLQRRWPDFRQCRL